MYGYNSNNGVTYNGQERLDEIDTRIFSRNLPSEDLERVYDPRPSHTRRRHFPTMDIEGYEKVEASIYNQHQQFNPGTSAPYSGYAKFIDNENTLKNIFHPLQKGGAQGTYVPSSGSELYNSRIRENREKTNENPHNLLFKSYNDFGVFNHNEYNLAGNVFNNHTRQQRKSVSLKSTKRGKHIRQE